MRKAYHNPRGETCCYNYLHGDLAVLPDACHSGEVFQKAGSNVGGNLETWKPILSLAYLSLSPINDLVSSEWVPVGFLMLDFPVAQMQLDFSGVFESVPLHHVFQVPLDILS